MTAYAEPSATTTGPGSGSTPDPDDDQAQGTPSPLLLDARAARSAASAAEAAHPVRFTGWLCSPTTASRARRTASSTPGNATSGASGSRLIGPCCHPSDGLTPCPD